MGSTIPFSLIVKKFFEEPKLQTLVLKFTDQEIALNNKLTELKEAEDFKSVKNAHLARLRAESLSIIHPEQLLPKAVQNATEINVGWDHDPSNDINATSIESEENMPVYSREETSGIDRIRLRRSAAKDSDFGGTSDATRLRNWVHYPRLIAENMLRTTGEIFTMLRSNIHNLSSYLPDINFSGNPDSLNEASILGNKTSIVHPIAIQEYVVNAQDVPLKTCFPLKLVDPEQGSIDGVSCRIPNAKINFFHNTFDPAPFEQPEDSFTNCHPTEWYDRPSVICEGEKTTAIVIPHLPHRIFDPLDSWLMLGQLTIAMLNQFFSKPVNETRYQLVEEFSLKISFLLEIKLTAAKLKLKSLQKQKEVSMKELNWISLQLEDRQEEFEQFRKLNRITNHEVTEFTENLFALQEMLDEVEEMPTHTSSNFAQKDNDVFARAANGNYSSHFFGLTRPSGFFEGAANQINTVKRLISASVS